MNSLGRRSIERLSPPKRLFNQAREIDREEDGGRMCLRSTLSVLSVYWNRPLRKREGPQTKSPVNCCIEGLIQGGPPKKFFLESYTYTGFFTHLRHALVFDKQVFTNALAWISKHAVRCIQHTAGFVLALVIYNRVWTRGLTSVSIIRARVTVLPSIHRFQNIDCSSTAAAYGRSVMFTNGNGQWVCI